MFNLIKKDSYENISIHLTGEPKEIDTSDIAIVTMYSINLKLFEIVLGVNYTLTTGETISRKEYRRRKLAQIK